MAKVTNQVKEDTAEMEDDLDNVELTAVDALAALIDEDLLGFREIMDDLLTSRAADYINAARDELAQNVFNLDDVENDGDDIEEDDNIEEEFDESLEFDGDVMSISEALKSPAGRYFGHIKNDERGNRHIAKIRAIISKHNKENPDDKMRVDVKGRLGKDSPHREYYKKERPNAYRYANFSPEHSKYFGVTVRNRYKNEYNK